VMFVLFVCDVPYELTVPLLLRSLGVRMGLRTGVIDVAPGAFVLCLRRR
jgi:hypothetical protein